MKLDMSAIKNEVKQKKVLNKISKIVNDMQPNEEPVKKAKAKKTVNKKVKNTAVQK